MQAVRLRLRVPNGSFPGVDTTLAETAGATREALVHFEWLSDGSYTLFYRLDLAEPGVVETALEEHDEVLEYDLLRSDDRWFCFVHVDERDFLSDLLEIAESNALVLDRPIQFVEDGVRLTIAGTSESLREAFQEATGQVSADVEWSGEYEPDLSGALVSLTSRQRDAIRTAYELGFYEKPRQVGYEEIGEQLGCAPSTANELLRRAETEIIGAVLDH